MFRPAGESSEDEFDEFGDYSYRPPAEERKKEEPVYVQNEEDIKQGKLSRLYYSIVSGNVEDVQELLEEGIDVNTILQDDYPLIIIACSVGNPAITELLISKGADVNAHRNSHTPLMAACACPESTSPFEKSLRVVELLLENGADLNKIDRKRMTAFLFAAQSGNLEIIKFLYSKVQNVNAEDNQGWNALFWAVNHNNVSVVKFLLEKGFKTDKLDVRLNSLLHYANAQDFQEIIDLLPEKKSGDKKIYAIQEQPYNLDIIFKTAVVTKNPRLLFQRDIACILYGMKCENLKLLETNDSLGLFDFLTMQNEDLVRLGVLMPYQRYTILRGLYRFHKESFKVSSVPYVKPDEEYDTIDIAKSILAAIRHLIVMEASVVYLLQNAKFSEFQSEDVLEKINGIKLKMEQFKRICFGLKNKAAEWDKEVEPVDFVDRTIKPKTNHNTLNKWMSVITVASLTAVIMLKYKL